jgi:tryptophanyl-tRNA synthetase
MRPTIFSGIKPSGDLTIGNYIGAISQWVKMQEEYNCIFCVVDYHAITVKQDPELLKKRTLDIAKFYIASGLDPKQNIIFKQSDIRAHTELCWLLNCVSARVGDMNKMTQFKDKAGKNQETVSVGLYDYPVLMAADILLYNTDAVPVGEDQVQHVELCRTLARRFNQNYSEVFKIPEVKIKKEGARIMDLINPERKMSKSDANANAYIALLDKPEEAKKKIMRATTDSDGIIKFEKENKPGISNLLIIYSNLANISIKDLEKNYQGKGYGDFKKDLAEVVALFLKDFQTKYNSITDAEVKEIMTTGADKIRPIAEETLLKVKAGIGVL